MWLADDGQISVAGDSIYDNFVNNARIFSTLKSAGQIYKQKSVYTIVIVTHNRQQAARVSDYTALM